MSQYISFFVKHKDSNFYVPIGDYSRNHKIYKIFNGGAPYGQIALLTYKHIEECYHEAIAFCEAEKTNIANVEKLIQDIRECSNDIYEKLEAIEMKRNSVAEYEEELEEYMFARHFCSFLANITEDGDVGIYFGIETGNPNKKEEI